MDNKVESIKLPEGLPKGGTLGQILSKASNKDFDVVWSALSSGGIKGVKRYSKTFSNISLTSDTGNWGTSSSNWAYGTSSNLPGTPLFYVGEINFSMEFTLDSSSVYTSTATLAAATSKNLSFYPTYKLNGLKTSLSNSYDWQFVCNPEHDINIFETYQSINYFKPYLYNPRTNAIKELTPKTGTMYLTTYTFYE